MRKFVILAIVLVLVLLAVPLAVIATPPTTAHVHFGDENAGSPFPPSEEGFHDQSFHAADKMVPRTVVISQFGSVTFTITPPHQVAIYGPGTTPEDINLDPSFLDNLELPDGTVEENILINYPVGRKALGPAPSFEPTHTEWTTTEGTFDQPGRYLVICTIAPHFVFADMYGWVIVR